MHRPTFVVLSGPPASGKTTLARPLARDLGLPLFEKDTIKERLASDVGEATREISRSLGIASIQLLFEIARELLDAGQPVMIEAYLYRGVAETQLEPLVARSSTVLVHCTASPDVLFGRYSERMATEGRHPIHEAGMSVDRAAASAPRDRDNPLELPVPKIIVSTTEAFPPPREIAAIVRRLLDRPDSSPPKDIHWP